MDIKKIPKSLSMAIRYSALYICTIIGAGFATGRELLTYFARFGVWGFAAAGFCCIFFAVFLYKTLSAPPKREKKLLTYTIFVFNIIIYSSMLAAASEVIPLGRFMTALITGVTVMGGLTSVTAVSSLLMPAMLGVIITIGLYLGTGTSAPPYTGPALIATPLMSIPFGAAYAAYNIITPAAVFSNVHTGKRTAAAAGLISGIVLCTAMYSLMTPLYLNYPYIRDMTLPLRYLTEQTPFRLLYTALLITALYTTAVSCCKAIVQHTEKYTGSQWKAVLLCSAAALFLSLMGFDNIVDRVYFVFGFAGAAIIADTIW